MSTDNYTYPYVNQYPANMCICKILYKTHPAAIYNICCALRETAEAQLHNTLSVSTFNCIVHRATHFLLDVAFTAVVLLKSTFAPRAFAEKLQQMPQYYLSKFICMFMLVPHGVRLPLVFNTHRMPLGNAFRLWIFNTCFSVLNLIQFYTFKNVKMYI